MKARFYKVPVHVQNQETRNKEKAELDVLPEEYDEGVMYLIEGALSSMTYDKELKVTEMNVQGVPISSPLTPKEIMKLPLIEYDSEKQNS